MSSVEKRELGCREVKKFDANTPLVRTASEIPGSFEVCKDMTTILAICTSICEA